MKSLLRKIGLLKQEDSPEIVSLSVSEDVIREKITESRDFRLRVTEHGDVSAFGKNCESDVWLARDEMLIWFHCKSCNRYSFTPPGNINRDAAFAAKDGAPLEYECFFIDFPPQLQPPAK